MLVNQAVGLSGIIVGDIDCDVDNRFDIGSADRRVKTLYCNELDANSIVNGSGTSFFDVGTVVMDPISAAFSGTMDVKYSVIGDSTVVLRITGSYTCVSGTGIFLATSSSTPLPVNARPGIVVRSLVPMTVNGTMTQVIVDVNTGVNSLTFWKDSSGSVGFSTGDVIETAPVSLNPNCISIDYVK